MAEEKISKSRRCPPLSAPAGLTNPADVRPYLLRRDWQIPPMSSPSAPAGLTNPADVRPHLLRRD